MFKKLSFILLLTTIVAFQTKYYSQTATYNANIYNDWIKLSITGKNQTEIENYLLSANVTPKDIEALKEKLREELMNKFFQQNIQEKLEKSMDLDDLNVIKQFIIQEIRYAGLQRDQKLRQMIEDEYDLTSSLASHHNF